eukprot:jgi/Chlat1/5135/Chrsp33S05129
MACACLAGVKVPAPAGARPGQARGACRARPGPGLVSCQQQQQQQQQQASVGRRSALVAAAVTLLASSPGQALAAKNPVEDNAGKELIQGMLERSKANKEKYDKERLDSFYRRNYTDYFDFATRGRKEGEGSASQDAMLKWLNANRGK